MTGFAKASDLEFHIRTDWKHAHKIWENLYKEGSPITALLPIHQLDGTKHTVSGLTAGHVLTALTPTTFGFAAPVGGDIPAHQLDGAKHTVSGLTPGHFLKALTPTTFGFAVHGLTYSDVGAAAAGHDHSGVYDPAGTGHAEASAHVTAHENAYAHGNIAHGETAYGWGNHAGLYSLLAHNHSGVYEPVLGNPASDGYILSSTALGVRSWIAPSGGGAHNLLSATHGDTTAAAVVRGDVMIGVGATPKWERLADVAAGAYFRSGGVALEPLWSTLILPNAATAFRLPVATGANTIGELAAVGQTGQYLSGVTGAIPAWATLNQAAVDGLKASQSPTFTGVTLSGGNLNLDTDKYIIVAGNASLAYRSDIGMMRIGTTNAVSLRFIAGAAATAMTITHTTGLIQMGAYGAGAATFDASGNITSVSDERLKNISGPFTRGLKEILALNPITYRNNKDSGLEMEHEYSGFSAQQVMAFIPEAVGVDSRGYYTFADRPIIAACVNSIKELADRIKKLETN